MSNARPVPPIVIDSRRHRSPWAAAVAAAALIAGALSPSTAAAQSKPSKCRVLCTPTVDFMPGMIRSHLFGGPTVTDLATGKQSRIPGSSNMELIFVVASRTAIPRLSAFGSVAWLPNATAKRNPFTLYTASDLGESVKANAPTVTAGGSFALVTAPEAHGWADLSAVVASQFSQAARPTDDKAYTHKLDLELFTHVNLFAHVPEQTYLQRVSLYGILDFVATGLPRAGDEVPKGRRFDTNARPTALIFGLALPITPAVQ